MKKILFTSACLLAQLSLPAQVTMHIDAAKRGPQISPYQYGLFFEEINHAGDGGLYAEMVKNRSFDEELSGWTAVGGATIQIVRTGLLNDAQTAALRVNTQGATATDLKGVANEGYWGMAVVKDSTYHLSFYAKGDKGFAGQLTARLVSRDGKTILGTAVAEGQVSGEWNKLSVAIRATATDGQAQLQLLSSYAGQLTLDMVSLFPYTWKNRPNGLRPDLAQLLADTKPSFLRFPGGCYVEGEGSYDNAFQWKKTIGPIEQRPGHLNQNWHYRSTDGLGFDEYLQLCEDLGAAPLFVVNVGLGHGFTFTLEETKALVQDALDAIEYANGDASTVWGAKRIANGHPEPYNLKFIEIGNENYQAGGGQQSEQYAERYYMFYKAIKEKYPEIITIGNVEAWGTDNPTWRNNYPVELVDEHYYRSHAWMRDNDNKYDGYPRTIGIYNGEYAANSAGTYGRYGNMNSALGEAVYMLGMERNSDVCRMASFAPIFMHESDPCWPYDMIHFNAGSHFVTPSYYVQQLMANHLGEQNLLWTESGNTTAEGGQRKVGVGSWNTQVSYDDVVLTDLQGNRIAADDFAATNSQWTFGIGNWSVADGVFTQSRATENCTAVLNIPAEGGYIYKVRARKNGGNEGFLILFNYQDANNYTWWNLGGWNNRQHGIENCVAGAKSTLATASGWIENDRWYDIEIQVNEGHVTCKLDGETLHEFDYPAQRTLYQSVQIDETNGELLLKVVNPHASAQTLRLEVANMEVGDGTVYRLASANGTDENTMDDPYNVKPIEERVSASELKSLTIPAYSLNIYRLKASNIGAAVKPNYEAYEQEDADKFGYLYAHMHTTQEITCYALSENANYWRDLFDSREVFDTKKYTFTGGMRDAFVYRTQNGKFMLAGTDMTSRLGWTSNHRMTFMLSNDLVHWDKWVSIDLESAENLKALGLDNAEDMKAAWAPQIIFDPITEKYVIYYSVGFPDRHRIYYSLMDENLNILSEPRVFYDPGFDVIDADIVWNDVDRQYTMVFKREGDRALSMATADHLVPTGDHTTGSCQWKLVDGFGIDEPGQSIEAPSQFRYIGNTTWKLGYQKYSNGYNYRLMDLDEHGRNPKNRMDIQGELAAQHGSFVKLTEREYRHLEAWERVVNKLDEARRIYAVTPTEDVAAAIALAEKALNENGATFADNEQAMMQADAALAKAVDQTDFKQALLDKAHAGEQVDLTPLVENADFSKGAEGWERTPAFTAANGYVAEYWNTNFTFGQRVDGLPQGQYQLTVQAFFRMADINTSLDAISNDSYELNAFFFANEQSVPVKSLYDDQETGYSFSPYTYPDNVTAANAAFNEKGQYVNTLRLTLDKPGSIYFGIRKENYHYSDWCCFDNFTLRYLGNQTGIREVNTPAAAGQQNWYNLQGQPVAHPEAYQGILLRHGGKQLPRK